MSAKEILNLEVKTRAAEQKVNELRAADLVPAVLYGHNTDTISLSVPGSTFEKVYGQAGESTIINLKVDDGEPLSVLIHDVQRDGVKNHILHADFYKVNMTEKLTATVPLVFVNEAPAVKQEGGTLVHPISEVDVESLPMDLPSEIQVDISGLKTFDDVIRVEDLNVDRGKVEIQAEPDAVVAMVEAPRSEEELAELETAVEEDVSKVEGVAEEKEGEEAEAGEGEAKGDKPEGEGKEEKESKE